MKVILVLLFNVLFLSGVFSQQKYPLITPVNFSKVTIQDSFWKPKIDRVSTVTVPVCIEQTEVKTPRIRNFEKVARGKGEKHEGIFYDDSDVFKALEAIAYSLNTHPDKILEKKADEWIDKIAAAQLPDGYINTYYTLGRLDNRWTDMSMHEDYNGGHLIEAAVAYYHATGKRKLLDVAIRFADHFDSLFGPGKRDWVTGHEELELALVKLYRVTNNKKYLDLSNWLIEERGHKLAVGYTWTEWKDTAYAQDIMPVKSQKEITGHAVRAMYLYTGVADVASLTGDDGYMGAMRSVWEDVVYRNMYITGGIGSSGSNEGFSNDYELPNENAYCETCASVGMVFWNQRMNQLTGESKYIDVLERSLYNAASDGLSLDGKLFFYGNPLASDGRHKRREWFGTACCPANIARLVESLGNYIYAKSNREIFINLFIGSSTMIELENAKVSVSMETNYPWDGDIKIEVSPEKKSKFAVKVRVPGWALGRPVPGDTYRYMDFNSSVYSIMVNGEPAELSIENGYAIIDRTWKKGDVIQASFPMVPRRVVAREEVKDDINRVAFERGPLVFCVEHPDNDGKAFNMFVPDNAELTSEFRADLLGGTQVITTQIPVIAPSKDGMEVKTEIKKVTAIPYFLWNNRGQGQMQVWLPRKVADIKLGAK